MYDRVTKVKKAKKARDSPSLKKLEQLFLVLLGLFIGVSFLGYLSILVLDLIGFLVDTYWPSLDLFMVCLK